jgi:hypothetical protein
MGAAAGGVGAADTGAPIGLTPIRISNDKLSLIVDLKSGLASVGSEFFIFATC